MTNDHSYCSRALKSCCCRIAPITALVLATMTSMAAGQVTNSTLLDSEAIRTVLVIPAPQPYSNQIPRNNSPVINAHGDTAFPTVTSPGGERTVSYWAETNENAFLVASSFFQAPDITGDVMPVLGVNFPPLYNAAGQIAFSGGLSGDGTNATNNSVIWSGLPADLRAIARTGSQAPDANTGVVFDSLRSLWMNAKGEVVFGADLRGPGITFENNRGIWIDDGSMGRLVVRTGEPAPETEPETVFSSLDQPQIVASGDMVFSGTLRGPAIQSNLREGQGVWAERNGQIEKVARGGDDAPGFNGQAQFSYVTGAHMNRSGEVAFYGSLSGSAVSNGTGALWRESDGLVQLVAMQGQPAPAAIPGATIGEMDLLVSHNDHGDVAWRGELEGAGIGAGNNRALFVVKDDQLQIIAREDDAVPGGAAINGVVYERFESFSYPVLNERGQLAFLAETTHSRFGIWATDLAGELQLIALENFYFDVDDSDAVDMRQIRDLRFFDGRSSQDGSLTGFNDLGQVAFAAQFYGGRQGVFVSNTVAIPEPSAALLLITGVAMLRRPPRVANGKAGGRHCRSPFFGCR